MVLFDDDDEMETGFPTSQDSSGPRPDTDGTALNQPEANFPDLNYDYFLNSYSLGLESDVLFGSPCDEKTDFDFGLDETTTDDKQATEMAETNKSSASPSGAGSLWGSPSNVFRSLNQELVGQSTESHSSPAEGQSSTADASFPLALPHDSAQEDGVANKTSVAAAFTLTLPPTPTPAKETATDTNAKLSLPDSAPFCLTLAEDPAPLTDASNAIPDQAMAPSQGFPDVNSEFPSLDMVASSNAAIPDTAPTAGTNYMPLPVTAPAMAGSGGVDPYVAQQQAVQYPNIVQTSLTGAPQIQMPQPRRALPPGLVSTPTAYAAAYPVQPAPQAFQQVPPAGIPGSTPYGAAPMTSGLKWTAPGAFSDQPPAKKIRHRRSGNRRSSNDPSRWYQAPPSKPADWSPPAPGSSAFSPGAPPRKSYKTALFRYSDTGEWLGNVLYSRAELEAFLTGPAGDGRAPSRREQVTLWIQSAPAYELHRYGPDASICRWNQCPVKKNTISKGQFRVAFDERAALSGAAADPFRVAGYMHLFCFEACFELASLVFSRDRWTVAPDTRTFEWEERNPMALSAALVGVINGWVKTQWEVLQESTGRGETERFTPSRERLWYVLTRAHTSAPGYLEQLDKRNDIHVGKYMGDLRLYQRMKDEKLMDQRAARAVIEIEDNEDEAVPHVPAARAASEAGVGPSQVTRSAPRRPSIARYVPPAGRKRARSEDEDAETPCRPPPPAKRPRFDLRKVQAEVKAAVEETLKKQNPQEVRRVSRVLASLIPAVDVMPHYKRMEVESLVSREADRVRRGVVPKWGSSPAVLELGVRARE